MLWWNACFFNAPSPLTIHRTCLIRPERTTTSTLEPCFLRQHLNGCSRDVHRTNPPSNTHIIILDVHDQSWSYIIKYYPNIILIYIFIYYLYISVLSCLMVGHHNSELPGYPPICSRAAFRVLVATACSFGRAPRGRRLVDEMGNSG